MICLISSNSYFFVLMINTRSRRSSGIPCGDMYFVPRIWVIPLLEAITTKGDNSFSRARLRKEKHSMSSICTSSMKRTWRDVAITRPLLMNSFPTHSWHNLCFTLFSPLGHLGVNLLTQFRFDLSGVTLWKVISRCPNRRKGRKDSPANNAKKPCVLLLITSIS